MDNREIEAGIHQNKELIRRAEKLAVFKEK